MVKKEAGTQFLIGERSKKQFLTLELKRCLSNILFTVDFLEFVDDENGQKRDQLRKSVFRHVNALHKTWAFLGPVYYWDVNNEDDKMEYEEFMNEIYGRHARE